MYYSDDLIEEIRSRNDIVDVVSSYVKLQKKGSTYFGLCPFHSEKSPSFSVTPSKQMYYCFGCGAGGNAYTFIMKYENYSFTEAVKVLADRAGIALPEGGYSEEDKRRADLKNRLLEANKEAAKYYYHILKSERGAQGYEYLRNRGLSDETITGFGLGFSTNYSNDLYDYLKSKGFEDNVLKEAGLFNYSEKKVYDKFSGRVMFPIMDVNNRVIGFGGRVMGDAQPKYLNSPETILFDKSRNLYGLNIARNSRKEYMLICEGYMDVISLHQAGFNNAVASLGTAYTLRQAALIKRYVDSVYLTYDSDGAGVKAALRAIPISKEAGLSTKVINMKPYKDPDEFIKALGADEYEKRIKNARNSFLFEIDKMREETDINDPDMKSRFYRSVAKKLLEFSDELERNVYIDAVCEEYMLPKDSLIKTLGKLSLTISEEDLKNLNPVKKEEYKKTKEDGTAMALKTLLTWLIDDASIYPKIKGIIKKEDFVSPMYYQVADMLFDQLEAGEINPAKIINHFENSDEQSEIAGLFSSPISDEMTKDEREKVLNDILYNVKKNSIDYRSREITDIALLQQIIKEQNELSKIHITLS
ncbi:MAG: DNA primase [Lachnospiraceae bacterium]|nr:DNA primase [Lachnospiraceae bacterium]